MKCLSLRQPWASLIASGQKTIEVRSWRTHYRGPLVICASARPRQPPLPCGQPVCVVELIDVRPLTSDDLLAACLQEIEPEGLFAWVLAGAVPLSKPFGPIRGRLKLFDPPAALQTLCRRLLLARAVAATPLTSDRAPLNPTTLGREARNGGRSGQAIRSSAAPSAATSHSAK